MKCILDSPEILTCALRRSGLIPEEMLRAVRDKSLKTGTSFKDELVAGGVLTDEDICTMAELFCEGCVHLAQRAESAGNRMAPRALRVAREMTRRRHVLATELSGSLRQLQQLQPVNGD